MKLTMKAEELAEMVNICAMAIGARVVKPEYECVHIDACSDRGIPRLTVTGQDTGNLIRKITDSVTVEENGQALIPAKTLLNFLKLMDGDVTLKADGNNAATLKGKGKKVTITCMDLDEYESSEMQMEKCHEVRMNGLDYGTLVNSVAHCVGIDTGRIALTGINFLFDGMTGTAETCGLDGVRMAIMQKNAETNDTFSALIPGTSAKLIQKVIGAREDVSFRFGNGVVIAEAYDTMIQSSLLSAEYMDYRKLSKRENSLRVRAKTADLLNAVKMARVSAVEGKKDLIVLRVKDEESLEVSAMSMTSGAEVTVACDMEGQLTKADGTSDGNKIAFNGLYVENALKAQEAYGEDTILECKSRVSPMCIIPAGGEDCYFQLVLPVRRG